MAGAVVLVVAMIIALPFGLFVAGACWSALLGASLDAHGKHRVPDAAAEVPPQ